MSDDVRAPITPQAVDLPWSDVPVVVTVDASDVDTAMALFDRDVPDHAGILDATVTGG